jgi:hypothetical protein
MIILFTNSILGLLYVLSNYWIGSELSKWSSWNVGSNWTPFLIFPYRIPNTPQVAMAIDPIWNFPFIIFLVTLAVNLYYIINPHRAKKQV